MVCPEQGVSHDRNQHSPAAVLESPANTIFRPEPGTVVGLVEV